MLALLTRAREHDLGVAVGPVTVHLGEVGIIDIDERLVEVRRQDSEEPERVRDVLR